MKRWLKNCMVAAASASLMALGGCSDPLEGIDNEEGLQCDDGSEPPCGPTGGSAGTAGNGTGGTGNSGTGGGAGEGGGTGGTGNSGTGGGAGEGGGTGGTGNSGTGGGTGGEGGDDCPLGTAQCDGDPECEGDCGETGVTLAMPAHTFTEGDACYLLANVCNNEGSTLTDNPLFIVLDVYGIYFFAPSWGETMDHYDQSFPVGLTQVNAITQFAWPTGAGAADGIFFYAALTDPAITTLVGQLGSWEFAWH